VKRALHRWLISPQRQLKKQSFAAKTQWIASPVRKVLPADREEPIHCCSARLVHSPGQGGVGCASNKLVLVDGELHLSTVSGLGSCFFQHMHHFHDPLLCPEVSEACRPASSFGGSFGRIVNMGISGAVVQHQSSRALHLGSCRLPFQRASSCGQVRATVASLGCES
jgi:hypothetical protein